MKSAPAPILRAILAFALLPILPLSAAEKLKALIVDGQNNHDAWPKTTVMMRQYLTDSGLFDVDVARTHFLWNSEKEKAFLPLAGAGEGTEQKQPMPDPDFAPDFAKYNVVVSNFGWKAADWPEKTRKAFEEYMAKGGGLVVVHAADNSWDGWREFNKMIGLGGWGGRNEKSGPYVYYDKDGKLVRDTSPGAGGTHGAKGEFLITMREHDHPITKGLPEIWLHTNDECYSKLRGPAENMTVLATAADSPALQAAGRNEPMLMVIQYQQGRVFHTTLGHDAVSCECVGFITTFLRGAEWAATGKVTQKVPEDFPTKDQTSLRPFKTSP